MAPFGSTWLYLEILTGIAVAALVFFLLGIITGYLLWYRHRFRSLALQKEMDASESRATALHRKIEELNNRLRQHRQDELDFKDQIREQSDTIERAEVERLDDQQTISSLQRNVEKLESERDELTQTVAHLRHERERFDSVDAELKAADHKVASLTEELRKTEARATRLSTELDLIRSFKIEYQAIQQDKEILGLELEAAKLETLDITRRLKAEIQEVQRQKHSLNAQNLQLQDDLETLRERYESLLPSPSSSKSNNSRRAKSKSPDPIENDFFSFEEKTASLPKALQPDIDDIPTDDSQAPTIVHPEFGLLYTRPPGTVDDLGQIRGLGKTVKARLNELGIYHFSQIATWTDLQVDAISKHLNSKDRIQREAWREQCRELIKPTDQQPSPQ